MKILYTITGLTLGGAETITVNLASRMQKLGNDVKIMCLSGEIQVQVPNGIEVVNLQMRKTPLGFIKALRNAKKVAGEFKPDVVHANMFHAIVFSRFLRVFVKIPRLICTEHSNNFHGKLRQFLEHCTDFLSDVNTNVSEKATENFVKNKLFSAKKTVTVYNGIDLQRFSKNKNYAIRKSYNVDDNDFLFINISRFNEAKDHKNLLKAFDIVYKKQKNVKLMLVGTGELEDEIKRFCKTLDSHDAVIFTGAKSNVSDFYNSADCFVLSSAWEGLPLVVAEAMGCELPVVVTTSGNEVCQNEHWIVPIKNSECLAKRMLEICNMSENERIELGAANRKLVQKFNLNKIVEKWILLYTSDLKSIKMGKQDENIAYAVR